MSVADVGGLMYYGADLADSYQLVAWYVDRILKGSMLSGVPSSGYSGVGQYPRSFCGISLENPFGCGCC